jgi:hypothetical protein
MQHRIGVSGVVALVWLRLQKYEPHPSLLLRLLSLK